MSRSGARRPRRILDVLDAGGGRYIALLELAPEAGDEPGADPPERAVLVTLRDGLVVDIQGHDTVEGACAAAGIDPPIHRR